MKQLTRLEREAVDIACPQNGWGWVKCGTDKLLSRPSWIEARN